jgi:hypothetical protein
LLVFKKIFFFPAGDIEYDIGKRLCGAIVDYIMIFVGRHKNRYIGPQFVFFAADDIAALAGKAVQAVFGIVFMTLGTFYGAGIGGFYGIYQEGEGLSPDRVLVDENPHVHPAFVAYAAQCFVQGYCQFSFCHVLSPVVRSYNIKAIHHVL